MNKLLIGTTEVSDKVKEAIISYNNLKVDNRLLDGTFHRQTIGEPLKEYNIKCYLTQSNKDLIDNAYNNSTPITLNWYGYYYTGIIESYPAHTIFLKGNNKIYLSGLKIIAEEEGSL